MVCSLSVTEANRSGEEYTYGFSGTSLIVCPQGKVHSTPDKGVEGYRVANMDQDGARKKGEDTQLLKPRQPRNYREIVRIRWGVRRSPGRRKQ